MHEKRLTTRLINYWERMKKDGFAPQYERLNPSIINDIWQKCLVLETQPTTGDPVFTYVHCGEEISAAMGGSLNGTVLSGNKQLYPASAIVKRAPILFKMNVLEPIHDEGQFVNPQGNVVKFRACLLGFADHNNNVTHVLVGANWRVF